MKKMEKLLKFENFILEESSTQRNAAINTAVSRLKEEFGDTKEKFLKYAKENENAVEEMGDFIKKTLEPYIERIEGQEKLQNGRLSFDYNGMLAGMVSWILVQIEVEKMKKANKKENK